MNSDFEENFSKHTFFSCNSTGKKMKDHSQNTVRQRGTNITNLGTNFKTVLFEFVNEN